MTTVAHPHSKPTTSHVDEQHLSVFGLVVFSTLRQAFRGLYAAVACAIGALAIFLFATALFSPAHANNQALQVVVAVVGAAVGIVTLVIDDRRHVHRVQGAAPEQKGRESDKRA